MRIAIAGAGAMGSTFGGRLALAGHDVLLVDVDEDHLAAVARDGLQLRHADGRTECAAVTVTTDPAGDPDGRAALGAVEAVIVLCKGWANGDVAEALRDRIPAATVVATLQNGLGNDRVLADVLGASRVLPGTTTVGAHKPSPGVVDISPITSNGTSVTHLGRPRGSDAHPPGAVALAAALTDAGLPCALIDDADEVIWTKLALAATAGPLTAVLDVTVADLLSSEAAHALLRTMFDEIVAVAAAEGVVLDAVAVWEHAQRTFDAVGAHRTSMADDLRSDRRSEIDSFCIEISRRAAASGVATPVTDTVGRLLVAREQHGGLR